MSAYELKRYERGSWITGATAIGKTVVVLGWVAALTFLIAASFRPDLVRGWMLGWLP